jgi:hypothetical protein
MNSGTANDRMLTFFTGRPNNERSSKRKSDHLPFEGKVRKKKKANYR